MGRVYFKTGGCSLVSSGGGKGVGILNNSGPGQSNNREDNERTLALFLYLSPFYSKETNPLVQFSLPLELSPIEGKI